MIPYTSEPIKIFDLASGVKIASFISEESSNIDIETVNSFGEEWTKFHGFSNDDLRVAGDQYFDIISPDMVNKNSIVLDVGCGSGRWSKYLADRVKFIEAIDPSKSVFVATDLLADKKNVRITQASANDLPFADDTFDFVFSLGVLHHIPDTENALASIVAKAKRGAPVLVYLYYALDNKSIFFKGLFFIANLFRKMICKLPGKKKKWVCDAIAYFVYLPLVFIARFLKRTFPRADIYQKIPLSYYWDKSIYIIKNDALDRFGTPLEKRYTKSEIEKMMYNSGLEKILFSENPPYWHVVGFKK